MSEFDARAASWDADPAKVQRALDVAKAITDQVPVTGRRVLEVGCGTGLLGFALGEAAASVTLADTSDGMLAVLREKIAATGATNLHPLRLDLSVEPHGERYDLLCSLMTLHHIPDTAAILARFHEVLAPGGWLALADLDSEDGTFHGPEVEVHPGFDRAALQAQLVAAGFQGIGFQAPCEVRKGGRVYPVFLAVAQRP